MTPTNEARPAETGDQTIRDALLAEAADWRHDTYSRAAFADLANRFAPTPNDPVDLGADAECGAAFDYIAETFRLILTSKKVAGPLASRIVQSGWHLAALRNATPPIPATDGEREATIERCAQIADAVLYRTGSTSGHDAICERDGERAAAFYIAEGIRALFTDSTSHLDREDRA